MSVTFLFWNLYKKPLQDIIALLVDEHQVDVLILAECEIPTATMLQTLNPKGDADFDFVGGICRRMDIYTRFSAHFLQAQHEADHFSIRELGLPVQTEILLVAAHLPSKLHQSHHGPPAECVRFVQTIQKVEEKVGHTRTVVVGDLNMNPFDLGLVVPYGFNAVMTQQKARTEQRTVGHESCPFFYNPMWSRFGDGNPGPPGTYYYGSDDTSIYWHMLDQVLLRPALLDRFRNQDLTIIEKAGTMSLVSEQGLPNRTIASDHLPIMFKLDLS